MYMKPVNIKGLTPRYAYLHFDESIIELWVIYDDVHSNSVHYLFKTIPYSYDNLNLFFDIQDTLNEFFTNPFKS